MADEPLLHQPVMLAEVLQYLDPARGGVFLDCTLGLGGHARALVEAGAARVIGLDRDREALALARAALGDRLDRVELVHADYRGAAAVLDECGLTTVDGVLADLGVSSLQLDAPGRGFSFRRDEPLDMRMDRSQGPSVAEALGDVEETTLADLIYRYGEERYSRRIARAIVAARDTAPITTTGALANVVRRAIPHRGFQRIDPATRTFQALRIWINGELEGLEALLAAVPRRLAAGGRVVVIAFHSLEDRIVKHAFRGLERDGDPVVRVLTKHPVVPGDEELARNPRARSAKLRALERLP